MSTRLATLPIDHIEAELSAFPLASEAAFSEGLVDLCPDMSVPTRQVWRRAEEKLLGAWPAVSLDECIALRDRIWFLDESKPQGKPVRPIPLAQYLRSLAGRVLRVDGAVAVPTLHPDDSEPAFLELPARARTVWRWLSFALPPDLLLAAFAEGPAHSPPQSVETLIPALRHQLVDRGFAEIHLHLWAALDFPTLWVATLRALALPTLGPGDFESPGACFDEGKSLGAWLLRAAITRYLLAAFLQHRERSDHQNEPLTFFKFSQEQTVEICQALGAGATALLGSALDELAGGHLEAGPRTDHATLRSIYRRLIPPLTRFPQIPEDIPSSDPIARLVAGASEQGPEIIFASRGLRYLEDLEQAGREDHTFALLFWQVLRVRCMFFRHVVHRPLTPGLQWFIRTFQRMKPGRRPIEAILQARCAVRLSGHGSGLRSLEVRTSPETSLDRTVILVKDLKRSLEQEASLAGSYQAGGREIPRPRFPDLEFGVVFHFPRERSGGWRKGYPSAHWRGSHADPTYEAQKPGLGNSAGFRYARYYRSRRREARALARVLTAFPASLRLIRGIDVCADEQGVPTWVLAPLIRLVRDAGRQASKTLRRFWGEDVRPLRATVHAGEDFVHLLTGIRRLDEAIDFFGLQEGDRLGHALALGIEPEQWASRSGRLPVPRERRLLDLAWEWSWHARHSSMPMGRRERLEREIAIHSRALFGKELRPVELERVMGHLRREDTLCWLGFPDHLPRVPEEKDELRHVHRYLTSSEMFRRGRQTVRVNPADEIETLSALQEGLRRKVGSLGLTIEVNPSSNLLVGHLGELRHHPLWRLRPVQNSDGIPPLTVCLGSDDPLTFGASLPEEYQLIHDTLLLTGHSDSEAQSWLEDSRRAGLDARFTLPFEPFEIVPWVFGDEPALDPPP